MGSLTQPSRPWPHGPAHLTEEALHLSGFKVLAQPLVNQHLGSHLTIACVREGDNKISPQIPNIEYQYICLQIRKLTV